MTDLFAVFDDVAKQPFVDPKRQGIAGASYGGYAVDWILDADGPVQAAAVTHDGVFNLESMAYVDRGALVHGLGLRRPPVDRTVQGAARRGARRTFTPRRSRRRRSSSRTSRTSACPVDQGLQLFTLLRRNGVPSEALVFPDEGHWVLKPLNSKRWHETVFRLDEEVPRVTGGRDQGEAISGSTGGLKPDPDSPRVRFA